MPTIIYTEPTINDTQGFYELFKFINVTADNLFFPTILLVIWLVVFINSIMVSRGTRSPAATSWVFASFICFILSIPLVLMNVLNQLYMYGFVLSMAIGLAGVYLADARS